MTGGINWEMVAALATIGYTILVFIALVFASIQTKEMRATRRLQNVLVVFREVQTRDAREARRYLYAQVPSVIVGIADEALQRHLENAEEALVALDRIGFLVEQGHVDPEHIMDNLWAMMWRSWQKCRQLTQWSREKRNDPTYLAKLEYLFSVAEAYRLRNNYSEPRFY